MYDFYSNRLDFLDSAWINEVNYETAIFIVFDDSLRYITVTLPKGTNLSEYLPEIRPTEKKFLYWENISTHEVIDTTSILDSSDTLIAVFDR